MYLNRFTSINNEDANMHLVSFFELYEMVKVDGNTKEAKRISLFPLSLKDYAKGWLNPLLCGMF